jgi:hypothetical protein
LQDARELPKETNSWLETSDCEPTHKFNLLGKIKAGVTKKKAKLVPGDGIGPNVCPFDLVGWLAQRKLRALCRPLQPCLPDCENSPNHSI